MYMERIGLGVNVSTASRPASSNSNHLSSLSIIIPTFNSSQFILKALDSVFAQYHMPDEVIITDNCSTDNTLDLVARHYPSVKLLRNKENVGPYKNWMNGIREANSEFFILLFSDDILQSNHVATLLAAQASSGAYIVLPNPRILLEDSDSDLANTSSYRNPGKAYPISPSLFINLAILTNLFQISPCGILFNRRFFISANLSQDSLPKTFSQKYPECLANGAGIDHLLILNYARKSNKILVVDQPTLIFRQHKLSFSTSVSMHLLSSLYASAKITFLNEYNYYYLLIAFYFCVRKASLQKILQKETKLLSRSKPHLFVHMIIFYIILTWSRFQWILAKYSTTKLVKTARCC